MTFELAICNKSARWKRAEAICIRFCILSPWLGKMTREPASTVLEKNKKKIGSSLKVLAVFSRSFRFANSLFNYISVLTRIYNILYIRVLLFSPRDAITVNAPSVKMRRSGISPRHVDANVIRWLILLSIISIARHVSFPARTAKRALHDLKSDCQM